MAPVVQKSQVLNSNVEEGKCINAPNVCSPNHVSPRSDIDFPECAADHVSKIIPDEDAQQERPTRAYSIGSRGEHSRMFKQHMGGGGRGVDSCGGGGFVNNANDNEQSNVRVRAFSVGSRAKIPRCDLQRGVLTPKLIMEQQQLQQLELHCHSNNSSNNNICAEASQLSSSSSSASTAAYNHLMHMYACRDKKSTSAPLLIHKSQTSVDRMSDLMEIDFSIKPSSNSTSSRMNFMAATSAQTSAANKTSFSKSVPACTTAITIPTVANSISTTLVTSSSNNQLKKLNSTTKLQQQQLPPVNATTDNGYLEMKPVGSQTNPTKTTIIMKKQQQPQQYQHQQKKQHTTKQQRPKTMLSLSTSTGVDLTTEKSNINANLTSNITTTTTTTTIPITTTSNTKNTTTVLSNKIKQQLVQTNANNMTARQTTDNDNNSQMIVEDNNTQLTSSMLIQQQTSPEKTYNLISQLTNTTTKDTSTTTPTISSTQQQQQQECKINQNIEDYINIERKFDEYMTLNANPNSNNYDEQLKINNSTKATETATATAAITATTTNLQDNDKALLLHTQSQDEQHNNTAATTIVHKVNRKGATLQHHDNDTGYEILQIKSDSSLQAHKAFNHRPAATTLVTVNKKDNNNKLPALQQNTQQLQRPRSTNSSALMSSTSASPALFTSSSTSCLHPNSTAALTAITAASTSTTIANTNHATTATAIQSVASSRPSSVNLEHELYYASLDWPQCSKELRSNITVAPKQVEVLCADSGLAAVLPVAPNVYAKIDFDHSDSSSSSSKNI